MKLLLAIALCLFIYLALDEIDKRTPTNSVKFNTEIKDTIPTPYTISYGTVPFEPYSKK